MEEAFMNSQEHGLFDTIFTPHSRRSFLKRAGALGLSGTALTAFLEACGGTTTTGSTPAAIPLGPIDLQTLTTNAKKEGQLQAIGIPPEWADYKDILAGYTKNYGLTIAYQAEAEFSSAQELEVFKNSLKDPKGNWCTEYYGAQAFVINTDLVKQPPATFQDLLKPAYKNMIGIDGDPRQANDAFIAVFSSALANGGSLDNIQPGIDFFAKLKKNGNFSAARSSVANISKGEVAIAIMWDYLGLGFRDQLAGKPNLQVVIPSDGSLIGPYVSIVNKTAPHPYAARLWIEYIFSDEGQLFYLTGYAHPARYQALVSAGKVPADLAAKLPPAAQYANVKSPSPDQLNAASSVITQNWGTQVLGQ